MGILRRMRGADGAAVLDRIQRAQCDHGRMRYYNVTRCRLTELVFRIVANGKKTFCFPRTTRGIPVLAKSKSLIILI